MGITWNLYSAKGRQKHRHRAVTWDGLAPLLLALKTEDGSHEPRKAGSLLESGNGLGLRASKKMGTSARLLQGNRDLCSPTASTRECSVGDTVS